MRTKNIFLKMWKTIRKYEMFSDKEKILVAVSGGIDSMALLTLLMRICPREKLVVIHINHKLRGRESDKDAEFVRNFCEKNNLSFFLVELNLRKKDVAARLPRPYSKQDYYREQRLAQIVSVAKEKNFCAVAFAHTLSDQVETFFMRLFRGTGPTGLTGIQPMNVYQGVKFVRPLIENSREEIEAFAKSHSISWREDATNRMDIYLRNAIRHHLIPIIRKKFGINIEEKINHLTELLREDEKYLDKVTRLMLGHYVKDFDNPNKLILRGIKQADETILRRIVRLWIMQFSESYYSPDSSKIETIARIIREKKVGKIVSIYKDLHFILKKDYGFLTRTIPRKKSTEKFYIKLNKFADAVLKEIGYAIHFQILSRDVGVRLPHPHKRNKLKACFDYSKIKLPIIIRSRKAGDKFQPLGMKGSKKVKDFFIDEKIPVEKRNFIPIFETNGKIFWITGLRIDERFKVNDNTKIILMIALNLIQGKKM